MVSTCVAQASGKGSPKLIFGSSRSGNAERRVSFASVDDMVGCYKAWLGVEKGIRD